MTDPIAALITKADELLAALTFDDSGKNGLGGNGGLISRETIRKADALRWAVFDAKKARGVDQ
ncbi:MAG: hypothetical protein KDK07_08055 [Bauldia sp.]|nr:hypothetical protein [Bauldia sp.]